MSKWLTQDDRLAAQVRARAEEKLWQEMGELERILTLARRLYDEHKRFAKNGLSLALHVDVGYPAVYLVSKERRASCRVWWCVNHFRLDASRYSRRGNLVNDYNADMTGDADVAARMLVRRLDEGRIWVGAGYLPLDLIYLDDVGLASLEKLEAPVALQKIEQAKSARTGQTVEVASHDAKSSRSWWRALFS